MIEFILDSPPLLGRLYEARWKRGERRGGLSVETPVYNMSEIISNTFLT